MTNIHDTTAQQPPALLTVKETAAYTKLGINRVYGLVKRPEDPLPSIKFGKTIRIPLKQLDAWLERQVNG